MLAIRALVGGRPNPTFFADYSTNINGTRGDGVLTGTASGTPTPSVGGGFLDLQNNTIQFVDYAGLDNVTTALQQGTINIIVRPDYTGAAPVLQHFCVIATTQTNSIKLRHDNAANFLVEVFDSDTTQIIDYNASWSPTSGTSYEIEYGWDITNDIHFVAIDGTELSGTFVTQDTGTRTTAGNHRIRIGANNSGSFNSRIFIDEISIYNYMRHTANYTP